MIEHICPSCGHTFEATCEQQRYCRPGCRASRGRKPEYKKERYTRRIHNRGVDRSRYLQYWREGLTITEIASWEGRARESVHRKAARLGLLEDFQKSGSFGRRKDGVRSRWERKEA